MSSKQPVDRGEAFVPRWIWALVVVFTILYVLDASIVRPAAERVAEAPETEFVVNVAGLACKEADALVSLIPRWQELAAEAAKLERKRKVCARNVWAAWKCISDANGGSVVDIAASVREHNQTVNATREVFARIDSRLKNLPTSNAETKQLVKALRRVTGELKNINGLDLLFQRDRLRKRLKNKLKKLDEAASLWGNQIVQKYPEFQSFAEIPSPIYQVLLLDLLLSKEVWQAGREVSRKAGKDCVQVAWDALTRATS